MAKTLDDAIEAVLLMVSTLPGLRAASNPQERYSVDPFATAFPGPGTLELVSSEMVKGKTHIILQIHKVRKDLPRDLGIIIPYMERVKNLLKIDANRNFPDSTGADTIDSIIGIEYSFDPDTWAEVPTVRLSFDFEVKIW